MMPLFWTLGIPKDIPKYEEYVLLSNIKDRCFHLRGHMPRMIANKGRSSSFVHKVESLEYTILEVGGNINGLHLWITKYF